MIRAVVSFCLRRRVIVLALLGLFVAAGVAAFLRLPVEAYPDVTNVQLQIITLFPGHAAEEVERLVTIPIENEMNGIPKRASMRSISIFGLSVVTIVFEDDADRAYVRNQAFERLSERGAAARRAAEPLPDATPVGEIFRYTLVGPPGFSPLELKALEDWVVERKLRTVPGIVDVVGLRRPDQAVPGRTSTPRSCKSYGLTAQAGVRRARERQPERGRAPTSSTAPRCTSSAGSASCGISTTSATSPWPRAADTRSGSGDLASVQRTGPSPPRPGREDRGRRGRGRRRRRGSCSCARARTPWRS